MRRFFSFSFCYASLVKQCRTATERKGAVFSVSALGSLTPAPGLNIRGAAAEKTGCMGPCTQPACGAAWRTAMETRSVTGSGGIRHSCRHFLFDSLMKTSLPHHAQQQQLLEKKMWSDNVNCCVAQMFISQLVKHPGIFPTAFRDHTAQWLPLLRSIALPRENVLINNSLKMITPLWREVCVCLCVHAQYVCMSRWHKCASVHSDPNQQLLQPCQTRLYDPLTMDVTGTSPSTTSAPQRCDRDVTA